MKLNKSISDKIIFIILMVLLCLPCFQSFTKIFNIKPLSGQFDEVPAPEVSFENYRQGLMQKQLEKYISENYGFREWTIRCYNQYLWDFFKKENVEHVVVGKDGWLFYQHHVDDYYGREMYRWQENTDIAYNKYEREIRMMNKLRAILHEYGIEFLMFIAPDKAFVYPEYLPEQTYDTTTINARKYYVRRLTETGFPVIDMTEWFIQMRDTASFCIMPSKGAHWNFSCVYGVDSLLRFMEGLTGDELAHIKISNWRKAKHFQNVERDIEESMNLFRRDPIGKKFATKEGDIEIIRTPKTKKPNVLFVGNSYLFQIQDYLPTEKLFSRIGHQYYHNIFYDGFGRIEYPLEEIDMLKKIMEADYVVFFLDGCQAYKTSYGFVENALQNLCLSKEYREQRRAFYVDSICHDPATLKRYAKDFPDMQERIQHIGSETYAQMDSDPESVFSELRVPFPTARNPRIQDILQHKNEIFQGSREQFIDSLVKATEEEIWHKPDLLNEIKKKAKAKSISLKQAVRDDAVWIVNDKINKELITFPQFSITTQTKKNEK